MNIKEREIIFTQEYVEFFESLSKRARLKLLAGIDVLRTLKVVSGKLAKKLTNTELYELRVSVDNEIRVLFFCVDSDSVVNATQIILLNGFIKKDTKEYDKQIKRAINILNNLEQ